MIVRAKVPALLLGLFLLDASLQGRGSADLRDIALVVTGDGVMHAHDVRSCGLEWRKQVTTGMTFIEHGQQRADLIPALDGSVFVHAADGSLKKLRGIRVPDIVDDAPFTTAAFPGIYFTGHKTSKVHHLDTMSLQSECAANEFSGAADTCDTEVTAYCTPKCRFNAECPERSRCDRATSRCLCNTESDCPMGFQCTIAEDRGASVNVNDADVEDFDDVENFEDFDHVEDTYVEDFEDAKDFDGTEGRPDEDLHYREELRRLSARFSGVCEKPCQAHCSSTLARSGSSDSSWKSRLLFSQITWTVGAFKGDSHKSLWGFNFTEFVPMLVKPAPPDNPPYWKDDAKVMATRLKILNCDIKFDNPVQAVYSLVEVPFQQRQQLTLHMVGVAPTLVVNSCRDKNLGLPAPEEWHLSLGSLLQGKDLPFHIPDEVDILDVDEGAEEDNGEMHLLAGPARMRPPVLHVTDDPYRRHSGRPLLIMPPLIEPAPVNPLSAGAVSIIVVTTLVLALLCQFALFKLRDKINLTLFGYHLQAITITAAVSAARMEAADDRPERSGRSGVSTSSTVQRSDSAVHAVMSSPKLGPKSEEVAALSGVPPESLLAFYLSNGHFSQKFANASKIGEGGFGCVFRAIHNLEQNEYAIKLVPVDLEAEEEINSTRIFGEINTMIQFRGSRHVVKYLTCWLEEPQFLPFAPSEARPRAAKAHAHLVHANANVIGRKEEGDEDSLGSFGGQRSFGAERSFGGERSNRFQRKAAKTDPLRRWSIGSVPEVSMPFSITCGSTSGVGFGFAEDSQAATQNEDAGERQEQPAELPDLDRERSQGSRSHSLVRRTTSSKSEPPVVLYPVVLAIQMEYVNGETLRQWLDHPKRSTVACHWTEQDCVISAELELGKQLLKGIKDIHGCKIIHRDLKPANIFVTNSNPLVLKIGDFGLAKSITTDPHPSRPSSSSTQTAETAVSGAVGTPGYMAPEAGGADISEKLDVFVASLILLELLCPRMETLMERRRVVDEFREKGVLPPHISPKSRLAGFGVLLRQMRSLFPKDRPTAGDALKIWSQAMSTAEPAIREEDEEENSSSDSSIAAPFINVDNIKDVIDVS